MLVGHRGDVCGADGWMKLHTLPKTKSFLFSFFWGPPSHPEASGLLRVCTRDVKLPWLWSDGAVWSGHALEPQRGSNPQLGKSPPSLQLVLPSRGEMSDTWGVCPPPRVSSCPESPGKVEGSVGAF